MKLLLLKQKHLEESLEDIAIGDMWKVVLNSKIDSLVVDITFIKFILFASFVILIYGSFYFIHWA